MYVLNCIKVGYHWHRFRNLISLCALIVLTLGVFAVFLQVTAILPSIFVIKALVRIHIGILIERLVRNILFDILRLVLVKGTSCVDI